MVGIDYLSHYMKYDCIVIGGGPAGMMAAGRAAELGARVLLLEKNLTLGKKLLITGGGRSNVTNAEFNPHLFLAKFKAAAKFLYSPLAQFGVEDTLRFFADHGRCRRKSKPKNGSSLRVIVQSPSGMYSSSICGWVK